MKKKIYVALPVKAERDTISECLKCIENQIYKNFEIWICVNQPDCWWHDSEKRMLCENNIETIEYLKSLTKLPINILDYSSQGNGWKGKKEGIGWARKILMDEISKIANKNDIIVSMDADTTFGDDYFSSIVERFKECPKVLGLLNPYFHKLSDDLLLNRQMLRYEIYMRHYTLSLWQISSPYSFAAMGSIISIPVWAYKKVGGISPKKSGEDFYFVQNIIKTGFLLRYNTVTVYPGTRYSDRVYFGTGPALIKGKNNDWTSYPIYPLRLFKNIEKTYLLFPTLFEKDAETPINEFLEKTFGSTRIWTPLRKNFKEISLFINACHAKFDGLRVLQYLKLNHFQTAESDNSNFQNFIQYYYAQTKEIKNLVVSKFDFNQLSICDLDEWRKFLFNIERKFQYKQYLKIKNG